MIPRLMEQPTTKPGTVRQSWYWCLRCKTYVDVVDPGEVWVQCARCHCRKVELRRPADSDQHHTNGELAHKWFERMHAVASHTPPAEPQKTVSPGAAHALFDHMRDVVDGKEEVPS